jgi:membrane protein YdbS with pleckstrin-like domain
VPEPESDATAAVDLDWLTLDADEEVLWASTPHKSSLVPAFAIGIPLSLVLVGIPILASAYLTYKNTNYVVTTRGLYRKRGIFSRDVKQISFDKVQNISYTQTAVGSSLGYGTVEISTAGSSGVELRFQSIPTPAEVQELISREIERRQNTGRDDEDEVDDVLAEILIELRGIRHALDTDQQTPADAKAVDSSPLTEHDKTTQQAEKTAKTVDEHDKVEDPFEPAITQPADDSANE